MIYMVSDTAILHDALLSLRAIVSSGTTDPISATRGTNSKFVMTAYPERPTEFPLIVITDAGINATSLGQQSEAQEVSLTFRIDIQSTTIGYSSQGRDRIWDDMYDALRTSQMGVAGWSGTQSHGLHNFRLLNTFNIDEPGPKGIHRKIATVSYDYYTS